MTDKDRRYFYYLTGILGAGIFLLFLIRESFGSGDFKVFLDAGKMMAGGESPYSKWLFISEGNYRQYFYSPLWAVLLIPFGFLPGPLVNFLWLLGNCWFMYRIYLILIGYLEWEPAKTKELRWIVLLTLLLSLRFILYNFEMIQMTIFLLWGSLEGLRYIGKGKPIAGGAILALMINIKLLPVVLLPYLLYRKEFRGFALTLFFSLAYLVLPAVYLGWDFNLLLHHEWWGMINPRNAEHLVESSLGPHSLTALIPVLLSHTEGVLAYRRNLADLDPATATIVLNATRAMLILGSLWFLRWPPFKPAESRVQELWELAYLFLVIPLIFPHQQKYAFFLMTPAIFYIIFFLLQSFRNQPPENKRDRRRIVLILLILFFLLTTGTTDGIIGLKLNRIAMHYKAITYGALLLIAILALCKPVRKVSR